MLRPPFPCLPAILVALCLFGAHLHSTTVVPFVNLAELTHASPVVVAARAMSPLETLFPDGQVFRDMQFSVVRTIKGPLQPGDAFSVRPYAFRQGDLHTVVEGDFEPEPGKTYLLYLSPAGDAWRPVMLSYYVFEEFTRDGEAFWMPSDDGRQIHAWPRPDGLAPEPLGVYRQQALELALKAQIESPATPWPGALLLADIPTDAWQATDRALPTDCDFTWSSVLVRWKNQTLNLRHNPTSAPADIVARLNAVTSAYATEYEGTDMSYPGAASPTYVPNCSGGGAQGGNFITYMTGLPGAAQNILIIFNDPCAQIADVSACAGTLAIGGFYYFSSTHAYKGDTWNDAGYGYTIVNDTIYPNCLSAVNYERMLTHEITHSHCMRHLTPSQYADQNMYPFCCNAIGAKDEECMDYVYEAVAAPVTLIEFRADAGPNGVVQLVWKTGLEYQNRYFEVEKSADGARYLPLIRMEPAIPDAPNTYEVTDANPFPGDNYYRLKQVDLDGTTSYLGIRQVTIDGPENELYAVPNPIVAGQPLSVYLPKSSGPGALLSLHDATGRAIFTLPVDHEETLAWDVPTIGLPNGAYWLVFGNGLEKWTTRIMIAPRR
ncbi:MAG: hypothetical protein SFV52_07355 [Saprospiraceae bacterium]|nr:hypothetical protein [Saprospiraceae bacterium]